MKLKFVYKILPAIVIYTDRVPEGSAGCANAMIVRIRPKYEGDEGLLQHELTHVKQAFFDDSYRLYAEVESYRKQLEYSQDKVTDTARFDGFISEKYDLDIPREAVAVLLRVKDD